MNRRVNVLGVGMIPFAKPGASDEYDVMGANAARAALEDAGIAYDEVEQAYAGYVFGESACGQAVMYRIGLTGIPVSPTRYITAWPQALSPNTYPA